MVDCVFLSTEIKYDRGIFAERVVDGEVKMCYNVKVRKQPDFRRKRMSKIKLSDDIKKIFVKNRKCIINTDIDGILAGMFLQYFLNWKVVGFSSCSGAKNDELWLTDKNLDLKDCVFVDLPVSIPGYAVVDQHFVSYDKAAVDAYKADGNKANPNVMRERVFWKKSAGGEYTAKYPFGTVHYVLAVLENMGIIDSSYKINPAKKIGDFELADLIFRADRVIGNTVQYTDNCKDWADWLIALGGHNTEALFTIAKKEYAERKTAETKVGAKLKELGCKRADGECSGLLRAKDRNKTEAYFKFVADAMELPPLPVEPVEPIGRLAGERTDTAKKNVENVMRASDTFSYAYVSQRQLSYTKIKEK